MYEIQVVVRIAAPIEEVFDTVADHERFFRGPDTDWCKVTREGAGSRNGLGAIREIGAGGMVFTEEITRFDRPKRLDYVVRRLVSKSGRELPLKHELGWMVFSESEGATSVEWRSRFEVRIRLFGKVVEIVAGRKSAKSFRTLLQQTKAELEAS